MLKLLIPVDGSDASLRALQAAARLGREGAVEALLVHVREGAATYHGERSPREYERIAEQALERQTQILEAARTAAQAAGLDVTAVLAESGSPDVDLPRLATAHGVDMIVMTTRGLGAVSSLLMGSVAQKVVHSATVPVLLVK
jgi:nucleotide-binding universal stress UspA family protein